MTQPLAMINCPAQFEAIRRDLHQHLELAYEEHRTAEKIADLLDSWGIQVHRGIAGTGVVGVLSSGSSSRSLGLRADMDALPVSEANVFTHASVHPGRMHACGHDGHCAMLLAAAFELSSSRAFDGTVYFIFQPAEEQDAGARRMIEEGLFERFPMDAVFGMHNWPGLPAGKFAVRSGPMMASDSEFRITVTGKGGHAAMPHQCVDPVPALLQIAQALPTMITRNLNPQDCAVVSLTWLSAGQSESLTAIADQTSLGGTMRGFSLDVLAMLEERTAEIAEHTAQAFGCTASVTFKSDYPPLINHPVETEFCTRIMRGLVGEAAVDANVCPTMAAEDFAHMLLQRPGCYVFIGNGDGEHRDATHAHGPCVLHNPSYEFNDRVLPLGASYWVRLAEAWLPLGSSSEINAHE